MTERGDVFALCAKMSQVPKKRRKNQDMFDKLDKFFGLLSSNIFFGDVFCNKKSTLNLRVFDLLSHLLVGFIFGL